MTKTKYKNKTKRIVEFPHTLSSCSNIKWKKNYRAREMSDIDMEKIEK